MLRIWQRYRQRQLRQKADKLFSDEVAEDWQEHDAEQLASFFNTVAGLKLMRNLKYTLFREVMDVDIRSEWDDGKRAGLALFINVLDEMATVPEKETKEELEEITENYYLPEK